jgi:hypothetical protein
MSLAERLGTGATRNPTTIVNYLIWLSFLLTSSKAAAIQIPTAARLTIRQQAARHPARHPWDFPSVPSQIASHASLQIIQPAKRSPLC